MREIRHPTLGEKTYNEIKNLIVSGKIKPGERLLYSRLVRELGVSQTPIKEAFTRLENEGYLVTITRKGTFAREFTVKEIREVFQIREMLEALAVRLVCGLTSSGTPEKLRAINTRFKNSAKRRDVKACTREDYAFHETLIEMSGNSKLREIMNRTNFHLLSIARSSPRFLEIAGEYSAMHAKIIEAIEMRNEDTAERLIRDHICYGRNEVLPFSDE